MSGVLVSGPVLLALVVGVVLAAVLAATAARGDRLLGTVTEARRHGTTVAVLALVAGAAAAAALWWSAALRPLGSGVPELALPLTFALVHSAVVLAGEATWPRPRGALRTAALLPRTGTGTSSGVAPRRLLGAFRAAAGLVALAGVAGWATADASGRALSATTADGLYGASAGPYPGAVFAVPALVGTALVVAAVEGGLRVVASRPAVAGADPATERALRRASAHRLLRGATAGVLVLAGGLLATAGTAVRSVFTGSAGGVVGEEQLLGHVPGMVALGSALAVVGVACGLAALAVLLLPAPRVVELGAATSPAPSLG